MQIRRKLNLAVLLAHIPTATVIVQLVLFYGFVLRARLALGRWPEPYRPDPKELNFQFHYGVVTLGGMVTGLMPLLAIVLLAAANALGLPRKRLFAAAVVFGACYLGGVALCVVDPGAFGDWFLD